MGRPIEHDPRLWMGYWFKDFGAEPIGLKTALEALGFSGVVVDEETSGDGHWFVAAFRVEYPGEDADISDLVDMVAGWGGTLRRRERALVGSGQRPDPNHPIC